MPLVNLGAMLALNAEAAALDAVFATAAAVLPPLVVDALAVALDLLPLPLLATAVGMRGAKSRHELRFTAAVADASGQPWCSCEQT